MSAEKRRRVGVEDLSAREREAIAENMKERIYATITLLAVIVALWHAADHHTVGGAVASMVGTVTALWLATIVASRMSYRAVHGRSMSARELGRLAYTSAGLFVPAIMPVLLSLVSLTGLFTLKTALMLGMVVLLLSLFALSFIAGRRMYTSPLRLLLVSAVEMLIGVGVVLLKLAVGE